MIKTITKENCQSAKCKHCGNSLINPGYNKTHTTCCEDLQRWCVYVEITTIYDDGRDEKGRFHHKSKIISRKIA